MRAPRLFTFAWKSAALGAAATAAGYLGWVALAWSRYGHAAPASGQAADPLLDQFMPVYDVVERHAIAVSASPAITFAAAADADLVANDGVLKVALYPDRTTAAAKRDTTRHAVQV